jgi:hypothetical protein
MDGQTLTKGVRVFGPPPSGISYPHVEKDATFLVCHSYEVRGDADRRRRTFFKDFSDFPNRQPFEENAA